jgi:hypothetical protein
VSAGQHRRESKATRRTFLGLGAAAAASIAAAGLGQLRSGAAAGENPSTPQTQPPTGASGAPGPAKAVTKPKATGGGPVPAYPGRAMLGAYLDLKGKTYPQALALRRRQLGRDERIAHLFYAYDDTLPSKITDMPKNAIPMVSWRGTSYEDMLNGRSDSLIRDAARRLAKFDRPVLLRWGWEMNGNWFAWDGSHNNDDPKGYIASWKYLRKLFDSEGAGNAAWVWSINWNSHPAAAWNRFQAYYPGDEYVDWVGLSGYNLDNESPATLYDALYKEYAARKPMMITEVGAVDRGGTSKGDWISRFAQYVDQRPNICAVAWFDTDTDEAYDEVWRIDTDAHSLAAYKAMATSPRFSG